MKELRIIDEIRRRAGKPPRGIVCGIGDDCAVLEYTRDRYLLWASDMLIENTHFKTQNATYEKIGRKAVAVNISDIAAMGGEPKYIVVSIGIPPELSNERVRMIYDGIFGICGEYNIKVIGGDTNRSEKLVIDVSIMGTVEKKRLVKRNGAKTGDLILITGPVRNGRKEHLDFEPRLKESRFLTARYKINSMIDVSDGIALDLSRVCSESGAGCRLYKDAIPLSEGLPFKDALYYGESFELLFTMSMSEAKRLFSNTAMPFRKMKYFVIGEIRNKKDGLYLFDDSGRVSKLKTEGYKHL